MKNKEIVKEFEYVEDYNFFLEKLANNNKKLFENKFRVMFDFRSPIVKRKDFNNIRDSVYNILVKKYGKVCQLRIHKDCCKKKEFDVDHYIPLSTNELNKKLRKVKPIKGRKVSSQSFGSNDISNLRIACKRCNSYKKHRFLFD